MSRATRRSRVPDTGSGWSRVPGATSAGTDPIGAAGVFDDGQLALGYARSRPPLHRPIAARFGPRLGIARPVARALDLGCGAGVSTRELAPFARELLALDPSHSMLLVAPTVVPGAPRVSADATALPVRTATIDLLGAAGSLPFVADLEAALAEMARVLTPSGVAVVYDFAPGRRITGSDALTTWYDEFLRRWPREPAPTAVTPATLGRGPLRVTAHEAFTVTLDLDRTGYLAAVMTESNVARAVQRGEDGASIERWCARGLDPIFPAPRPVEFDAWFAILRP